MSHPPNGRRPARPLAPARSGCGCISGLFWLVLAVVFWRWVLLLLLAVPVLYLLAIFAAGIGKAAFPSPRDRG